MPPRKQPSGGDALGRDLGRPLPPDAGPTGLQASADELHRRATDLNSINQLPIGREPAPGERKGLGQLGVIMAQANPDIPPPSAQAKL